MIWLAVRETGARQSACDLLLHPAFEHRLRALADALLEDGLRDVEAEDQRRVAGLLAPEPVARGCERPARLVQLQGADDSPAVVGVDGLRRLRIALGESGVRLLGPEPVVEALPALAGAGRWCRRELEVGERSAEIEARAADDDRRAPLGERAVDGLVCEALILGDGAFVVERPDADERGRPIGLVREDRQALVDLHRVGGDDL